MGSDMGILFSILGVIAGITLFVLALVFVAVPVFKGIGWSITGIFRLIGWLIMHIVEFVGGVLGDTLRFVGSMLVMLVLMPLVPLNIVIGRWSAAGHFAESIKRECSVGAACVYRAVLRRPLKFLLLDGVLEGLEQRLPEAMAHAPGSDQPSRRIGQFDGYSIVGSLRSGGSGAKLYVAQPSDDKRRKHHMPERVVIKAFALTEGSSLPQIVRESRALECAKQLGHVLEHGMDDHRFFYVMPYHPGEHLGVLTRQFHAECGGRGLDRRHLHNVMSHTHDLLATLSAYHKGGLWHKDVKPENVIVHDGRAHLVDLGLVTPLRSAMTLTTHGTEYFRDPEMVRQALRGVKVHQVDGAKFDIYAVGAVLYFMIENTFPAHGGLSRVTMPSPEALRWIVRRAMTDYNQRYENADAMLSDVGYVMSASDPHAVKPADLPSMRGFGVAGEAGSAQPQAHTLPHSGEQGAKDHVAAAVSAAGAAVASAMSAVGAAFGSGAGAAAGAKAAASPAGEGVKGFGIHAGIGDNGPFAKIGNFDTSAAGASAASGKSSKPKIVVTNWWTGAYRVEDEDVANGGAAAVNADGIPFAQPVDAAEARMFRGHASAFRAQADEFRRKVRDGTMSARRAAKEQIRAAKERAREMRARASAHRRNVAMGGTRHPSMSPWLFVIGFFVLVLLGGGLMMTFLTARIVNSGSAPMVSSGPGAPLLLVLNGGDPGSPRVQQRIQKIVDQRRQQGYDVITSTAGDADLCALIDQWWDDPKGPADQAIEEVLARKNAYGILQVSISGDARRDKNIKEQVVYSNRPGAKERRRINVQAILPDGPAPTAAYLLINDHPAKVDPEVEAVINETIAAYRRKGWDLKVADDVEVQVRKLLPPGKIESAATLPFMLRQVLEQAEMGGVVRIEAAPGEGKPRDRVVVTIINGEDVPKLPGPAQAAPDVEPTEGPTSESETSDAAGALSAARAEAVAG